MEREVSNGCVRMFSISPFVLVPQRMLGGLLTARYPPTQDWEAGAHTGLHHGGTSHRCKHKRAGCQLYKAVNKDRL